MNSIAWARSSASIISSSVASGRPTCRFSRIERANSIGSWNTTPMLRRSEERVRSRMSSPSMRITPDCGSKARCRRPSVVDLPEPVAPTSATVSPGWTVEAIRPHRRAACRRRRSSRPRRRPRPRSARRSWRSAGRARPGAVSRISKNSRIFGACMKSWLTKLTACSSRPISMVAMLMKVTTSPMRGERR